MTKPTVDPLTFDPRQYAQQLCEQTLAARAVVYTLCFSPDGRYMLAGCSTGVVHVFDMALLLREDFWSTNAEYVLCIFSSSLHPVTSIST